MARCRVKSTLWVGGCLIGGVWAQDEAERCYGAGSVVGAVVGTLIVMLGIMACVFFLYRMYWKSRKGKHLVLMTDTENPPDMYAFDNPCFREATPIKHIQNDKHSLKMEKSKWSVWPPVHTFRKEMKNEKITSMDDSYLNDPQLKVVTLKSHDFTGLGFNICGNMRDGIFVKDVLHRGPAFESGCINTGDRIDSVCISFRNMVFEDALTILSYASPYDVQVQLENDSCSRPSTLMRSKRESNAVNCSEKIQHPKFNRSQSVSHLNEIGNGNNKKLTHQMGLMLEKNRVNRSLNKMQDLGDYPTIKVSPSGNKVKSSPTIENSKSPQPDKHNKEFESHQMKSADQQNKLQKFGIKVLPISNHPKMGVQSVTDSINSGSENHLLKEKPEKLAKPKELNRNMSPVEDNSVMPNEHDSSKENVRAMLAKGFFSLKEKINQNTLGKKKKAEEEVDSSAPRGQPSCEVKAQERSNQNYASVPEEVCRAGDIARNNRKSVAEGKRSVGGIEAVSSGVEALSDSEGSSDLESLRDETKTPKKGKGKAPSPPKTSAAPKETSAIERESELFKDETCIFEPDLKMSSQKNEVQEESRRGSYDSDSDSEVVLMPSDSSSTKIELSATQVTVHHSPAGDTNEEEVEPNRKAASLGDLSKLDSEQPLSIVLERAVSLDLTEGTSQGGKKRKAPLPPSEEFPPAFDDLGYRKEPRLEGLNTFQRRLKKSSDFGTLEDALCDEPKSLEVEINKILPHDLSETHNNNIQEFSSWLAECRRPKTTEERTTPTVEDKPKVNSTSFVNINSATCSEGNQQVEDKYEFQGPNVSFRVNGKNFADFEVVSSENVNFPGANSRTVVVISQPNSLEPVALERNSDAYSEPTDDSNESCQTPDTSNSSPPKLPITPVPSSNVLSSPLSSPLTYVTEIKVSTSDQTVQKLDTDSPSPNSLHERIHRFDAPLTNTLTEASKIPLRTMKSETGQRVLATIQSLAKESTLSKTPETEYTKRVASLFPTKTESSFDDVDNSPLDLYLKAGLKPSEGFSFSRKVPPVVPPRKTDLTLPAKTTVSVGLPMQLPNTQERNIVTLSSFAGQSPTEDSMTSFSAKQKGEMNGGQDGLVPIKASATKIIFESQEGKDSF